VAVFNVEIRSAVQKFHRKRRQGWPQLLKLLGRPMHFKPHEFAGLQEFLQELTHVVQMGQRSGGASVALTAVQNAVRSAFSCAEFRQRDDVVDSC